MSLTNLNNATNDKTFIAKCYPTEVVTISTVHDGNIKEVAYVDYISNIRILGGVPVKQVSIAALANADDWYHDRDAGMLYYYTTEASVDVVITFGFFFKTGDTQPMHVDLDDTTTDLVIYEGRMRETSFIQSIDDISNGTLAISSTTISLINNDGYYQSLARDEISFRNSYIEVYIAYNVISNKSLVFTGIIESATFRSKEMILETKDFNKVLQNTAKFTAVESEYLTDTATYPGLDSQDVGKEIPYLLGRMTRVSIQKIKQANKFAARLSGEPYYVENYSQSWDATDDEHKIIPISNQDKTITAINYNGSTLATNTVRTRKFISYRTINQIKSVTKLRIYEATIVDLNPDKTTSIEFGFEVEVPVSSIYDYYVGQICFWGSASGIGSDIGTKETWAKQFCQARVSFINESDSRIRIAPAYNIKLTTVRDVSGNSYIFFDDLSVSFRDSDKNVYVMPIALSHTNTTVTNGFLHTIEVSRYVMASGFYGYGYLKSDNKEWILGGINMPSKPGTTTANDTTTELENIDFSARYQVETTNLSLGAILHRTLIEAGYRTDGGVGRVVASGTNSFNDLDAKLGTTYWTLHTGMIDTYLELLQMMLSSVFGFMYTLADGTVGVRLFEKEPYNHTVWNISEDDIVMDSVISDFNSGGIYTRLKSTNDTNKEFVSETSTSIRRLLHGDIVMENQFHFESKSIYETKVMPRKYEYLSNSIRKFDFTIINRGYDILIGDRISVDFSISNKWLGVPKTYDLFVIGLNKSLQGTTVTAIENIFPEL